jgi:hypothetical protein
MTTVATASSAVALLTILVAFCMYLWLYPRRVKLRLPERRACMVSAYALIATGLLSLYQAPVPYRLDLLQAGALSIAGSVRDVMVAGALICWFWSVYRGLLGRQGLHRRASPRLGLLLCVLAASGAVEAQPQPIRLDVADLFTCDAGAHGLEVVVLDPFDDADCAVGGGVANPHPCICSWDSLTETGEWVAVSGGGASSGGTGVPVAATYLARSNDQSITLNTTTKVTWDTEQRDDGEWHDTSTDTDRITVEEDGWYVAACNIGWIDGHGSSTAERRVGLVLNDTAVLGASADAGESNAGRDQLAVWQGELSASDYLNCQVLQTAGSNNSVESDLSSLSLVRLHYDQRPFGLLYVRDQKSVGTNGGDAAVEQAWVTRTLNTEVANTIAGASLVNNEVTLPRGEYLFVASAPVHAVLRHRLRVRTTAGATLLLGENSFAQAGASQQSGIAVLRGVISLDQETTFRLEHWIQEKDSSAGLDFGVASGAVGSPGEDEVYAQLWVTVGGGGGQPTDGATATSSSGQARSAETETLVAVDAVEGGLEGWDLAAEEFLAPRSAWYVATCTLELSAAGEHLVILRSADGATRLAMDHTSSDWQSVSSVLRLAAGDGVECTSYGPAVTIDAATVSVVELGVGWTETAGAGGGGGTGFVRLRKTDQSIASGGGGAMLTWTLEDGDTDSYHDTGSNTSRITIPTGKGGVYTIGCEVNWGTSTDSNVGVLTNLVLNGTTDISQGGHRNENGSASQSSGTTTAYPLSDGDYVECQVGHDDSASLSVWGTTTGKPTNFWAVQQ